MKLLVKCLLWIVVLVGLSVVAKIIDDHSRTMWLVFTVLCFPLGMIARVWIDEIADQMN
jgi:hypothetical protein